jgi:hypothetical protein
MYQRDVPTEYTEWQRVLSYVHSIMMEKFAQAGGGGGCMPSPFHYIYHHVQKVVVYALAERVDTLPLFLLYTCTYFVDIPIESICLRIS